MGDENITGSGTQSTPASVTKDPVCGMNVDPKTAAGRHEYGGKTYYFCNPRCLEKFRSQPEKYAK